MPTNKNSGVWWKLLMDDGFIHYMQSAINPRGVATSQGVNGKKGILAGHGKCIEAISVSPDQVPDELKDNTVKTSLLTTVLEHDDEKKNTRHLNMSPAVAVLAKASHAFVSSLAESITDEQLDDELRGTIQRARLTNVTLEKRLAKLAEFCDDKDEIYDYKFLLSFLDTVQDKVIEIQNSITAIKINLEGK